MMVQTAGLKPGHQVSLIAETWRAETTLRAKIGKVIERRDGCLRSVITFP